MNWHSMKRRQTLGAMAGSLIPLAGCLSGLGLGSESGVILTRLSIVNSSKSSHTVTVVVLYDGKTVHSQEYNVGPKKGNVLGGQLIDIAPADKPREVEIRAAMGNQIRVEHFPEEHEKACIKVQVGIESNRRLTFWQANDGTECFEE